MNPDSCNVDPTTIHGLLDAHKRLYVAVWQGGMKWGRELKGLRQTLPVVLVRPAYYCVTRWQFGGETSIECIHSNAIQRPFDVDDVARFEAISVAIDGKRPVSEVQFA